MDSFRGRQLVIKIVMQGHIEDTVGGGGKDGKELHLSFVIDIGIQKNCIST